MMTMAIPSTSISEMFNTVFSSSFSIKDNNTYSQINNILNRKLSKLDQLLSNANERFYKKNGVKLSPKQTKVVYNLIDCNYTSTPLISFYKDKIKVEIDCGQNQYMIDFSTKSDEKYILLGSMDDDGYSLNKILLSELKSAIK